MIWAAPYLPVPTVVAVEELGDTTILLTEALPGRDATDPAWRADLPGLVRALAAGTARVPRRGRRGVVPLPLRRRGALEHVARRVDSGDHEPGGFHAEHAHLTPAAALAELEATAPADEDLVVCHGDFCAPNVLLQEGGSPATSTSASWASPIAGGTSRSGPGAWAGTSGDELEPLFYEAYGIAPDLERIRFYRLLYDLAS